MPEHAYEKKPHTGTPGFLTVTLTEKKPSPEDQHLFYYPPGY